jgi:CubicO group peptidase (beta-lactamase class C family)
MRRKIVRFGGGLALGMLAFGLASAAHAETPFCSAQLVLVSNHLGPLVKPPGSPSTGSQAVGAEVVTLRLGEQPCFFHAGEIELDSGIAPDKDTIFELASVTKVFTTAILALRASQGLDVNAPVAPYLPPEYVLREREEDVTFQQLATFSGGFHWDDPPDFKNGESFSQSDFVNAVNTLVPRKKDAIQGEFALPTLNFYSNGSTGFLGQILMHMDSGKGQHYPVHATGFSNWISDNLTGPLKMPNTAVEPGGKTATGYHQKDDGKYKGLEPFPWVPWGAAGALRSNAADMLNFLAANICAHHVSDPACTGFPPDILTALKTAHRPNDYTPSGTLPDPTLYIDEASGVEQGWAWRYIAPPVPNPDNVTPIISKDGGHPGFSTYIGFNPAKAYGVVILMNTGGVAAKAAGKEIIQRTP